MWQWNADSTIYAFYKRNRFIANSTFVKWLNMLYKEKTKINVREHRRAIKNGKSRETSNLSYTRRRKTKQKHNTICAGQLVNGNWNSIMKWKLKQ